MKTLSVLSLLLAVSRGVPIPEAEAEASPAAYASDYSYYLPAHSPSSQYHSQDDVGQYNYGYQSAEQNKAEVKTADGVTRGSYSYIDANGILQTVNYISDAMGFRVAATNLPVHHVEAAGTVVAAPEVGVAAAGVAHNAVVSAAAPEVAVSAAAPEVAVSAAGPEVVAAAPHAVYSQSISPSVAYTYLPYAIGYNYHITPTHYVSPSSGVFKTQVGHTASVVHTPAAEHVTYSVEAAAPAVQAHAADHVYAAAPVVQAAAPVVQAAAHVAGPLVAPVDTPAVAAAKAEHATAYAAAAEAAAAASAAYAAELAAAGHVEATAPVVHATSHAATQVQAAAPIVHVAGPLVAPVDTPSVAAAKAQHATAYAAAAKAAAAASAAYAAELAAAGHVESAAPLPIAEAGGYFGAAKAVIDVEAEPVVAPVVQAAPVVEVAPVVEAAPLSSQYHSQDDIGQYSYGYTDVNSAKQEVKTADGIVRGSYSYVDTDGVVQTVNYIADALGYRVGATNLPVHHVEADVAAAPVVAAAAPVEVADAPVMAPQVSYSHLPYASNYEYNLAPAAHGATVSGAAHGATVSHAAHGVSAATHGVSGAAHGATVSHAAHGVSAATHGATVSHAAHGATVSAAHGATVSGAAHGVSAATHGATVSVAAHGASAATHGATVSGAAVPVVTSVAAAGEVGSQFHSQDDLGQYNYGYSNSAGTKSEVKTADGVTRGSYSYMDANGVLQTVNYISDAMGFRVAATNLPVHHVEGAVAVESTQKVHSSNEEVMSPQVNYAYLPYAQGYSYTAIV